MKNYTEIASEYHDGYRKLKGDIPEQMKAFGELVGAATKDGALSRKVKELIAMGIAIAARCDGCIAAHVAALRKAGATREEVAEMVGVAIMMGGGPSTVYGVEAMRAFDELD
ncbi:carboxymuconolactone decarboxylase family protein [Roseovarius sp. S1116L3]|uniref:carboxymuconolactone decarboxylase family protein n=1 Tax=Roseovarius roseus TaxID=3342636 RepID=UPI0037265D9C